MTEGATTAKNGITLFGSGVYTNPADDAFVFKAGDKVKVTLKAGLARVTTYSSLYEVTGSASEEWCVVEKIGETTIVPVEITPEQIIEFQAMPVTIKNVTAPAAATWNGTKTFTVGGTNLIVYTQSGAPWAEQTFVGGATGSITGYAALYKGAAQLAPRNVADIADFMGEPSTDPAITKLDPTSLSFAATDNAKTVTVTAANADDCTIEAATDKSEQFTTSVDGMVVTVTPKENTTEQAITATLTIKLMKAGAAVDTKTVAISQAGKSVPGGSGYTRVNAVTAGKKYLVVAEVNSKYVVMPAAAAMTSSKFIGVDITVSGGKIEANEANDAYAVTIEAKGDAFVIKNSAGKYIEHNSGTNFKLTDTSSKTWTINYDNDKNWFAIMDVATSTEKTKRQLLYQIEDGSTSNRFGPYSSSNADGEKYSGVALYELSE